MSPEAARGAEPREPGRMTAAMRAARAHTPALRKPVLPPSVRTGALRVDWTFTAVAALSFLLHFGFVGTMYSDWMDPVVDHGFAARFVVSPPGPPPPALEPRVETSVARASPSAAPTVAVRTPAAFPATPRAPSPRDVDALLSELRRAEVGVLVSPGGTTAIARALAASEGPPVDLDALGRKGDARPIDTTRLPLGVGSGPLAVGPVDLSRLHGDGAPAAATTAGTVQRLALPSVRSPGPIVSTRVADAEATLRRGLFPRAYRCYQRGLELDAGQAGRLVVVLRLAPSGEVASASLEGHAGLSDDVARCVLAAAQALRFEPPGPAGATIRVPIDFVRP